MQFVLEKGESLRHSVLYFTVILLLVTVRLHLQMTEESKRRVVRRVTHSGALPLSRDAPGYHAVLGMLGVFGSWGGDGDGGSTLGCNDDAEEAGDSNLVA